MSKDINRCPSCEQPLRVTQLACDACDLRLSGHFERGCRFCALDPDQRRLFDVFLSCRGVLREMEKELGLSYPTVRSRVNALLTALGYTPTKEQEEAAEDRAARRQEILDRLQAGEMTPEEAAAELRSLGE